LLNCVGIISLAGENDQNSGYLGEIPDFL